jgi:hypothetical protein
MVKHEVIARGGDILVLSSFLHWDRPLEHSIPIPCPTHCHSVPLEGGHDFLLLDLTRKHLGCLALWPDDYSVEKDSWKPMALESLGSRPEKSLPSDCAIVLELCSLWKIFKGTLQLPLTIWGKYSQKQRVSEPCVAAFYPEALPVGQWTRCIC